MEFNYGRKYEIIIGRPTISRLRYTLQSEGELTYNEVIPQESISITDLHFKAKISRSSKSSGASSDTTTFEIYNMSPSSRRYAELEGSLIILKAGYQDQGTLPIVYSGQIKSAETLPEDNGANVITKISAGDAYLPRKNSRISKFYPSYVSKEDIIKDLALSMPGVGAGTFATATLSNQYFNSGFSATGKTIEVLEDLCESHAHEVLFTNNRISVRPYFVGPNTLDFARIEGTKIIITPDLIKRGSGKMNNNVQQLSNEEENTKAGYKINTFLDGRLAVGGLVELKPKNLVEQNEIEKAGLYNIIGITHILSYRGNDWDTVIETEAI